MTITERIEAGEIEITEWTGLYREKWGVLIVPEAVGHPAKFSRGLIRHIYEHAIAEGWLRAGDRVADPFGGVALGAFEAMRHGLDWIGCELEQRFVDLGAENIAWWNERFAGKWPGWGSAKIVQGDSRMLAEVVAQAVCCVGSPPYAGTAIEKNSKGINIEKQYDTYRKSGGGQSLEAFRATQMRHSQGYGNAIGQLGRLPEGDYSAVIGSPPFVESLASDDPDKRGGLFRDPARNGDRTLTAIYGTSDGQLGVMAAGSFDAVVGSPPFEKGTEGVLRASKFKNPEAVARIQMHKGHGASFEAKVAAVKREDERADYGQTEGNIGNQQGDTFWSAAREIVDQCHAILAPGGYAIWVCKDFVRKRARVPFSLQWATLCESAGFRLVHWHRAMLVERHGVQVHADGSDDVIETARKSFFRLLAERKGSPKINAEDVLCMVRE